MAKWVVCPQCLTSVQGTIGRPCSECGTPQVSMPLSQHITAKVLHNSETVRAEQLDPEVWGE